MLLLQHGASGAADGPGPLSAADPQSVVPRERARLAEESGSERVFGGSEAAKGEFPFQVAFLATSYLDEDPNSQYFAQFCGGTLISPEWVLTAAHCMVGEDGLPHEAASNTVLVGATSLVEGTRHLADEVIVHENYNPASIDYDFALVRLAAPAAQAPILLPAPDQSIDADRATVIGWGLREDGTAPYDLVEGEVGLHDNETCNAGIRPYFKDWILHSLMQYAPAYKISEEAVRDATELLGERMDDPLTAQMLCAGTPSGEISSCHGDSGGPLFVSTDDGPLQIGVVSWGAGPANVNVYCGYENAYAVFARIASVRDWIRERTGI